MTAPTLQHSARDLRVGDRMNDGSYYFGVSVDTHKKFYVFLKNAAEVMTHDAATDSLNQKRENGETFQDHTYSAQQTEEQIKAAYENGTGDGGLRRLTENELKQMKKALEQNEALSELALMACAKNKWVQSATTFGENGAVLQNMCDGRVLKDERFNSRKITASVLLCCGEPS